MEGELEEARALVAEKRGIEAKLSSAGGKEPRFLLEDCSDLADMIDEIDEVGSKRGEKEHAAFDAKIKFSRKIRRKAKDLKNFEQHLVSEYESGHITLDIGKRMVSIIKLLRASNADKARREAEEFYGFLEMGSRLEIIDGMLLKKRAQLERAKRSVDERLAGVEWLENELPVDKGKAGRHERGMELREKLFGAWAARVHSLKSMPMEKLLLEMREGELGKIGFPHLPAGEAGELEAYLRSAKLETKNAQQLHEMAGQSEQRLRHLGLDLAAFRREVADRKHFLFSVMSFPAQAPGAHELAYLSAHDENARKMGEELAGLEKTGEEDVKEWGRAERIKKKREELGGDDRAPLEKSLKELSALQDALDGKDAPAKADEGDKGKGIAGSILKLFGMAD